MESIKKIIIDSNISNYIGIYDNNFNELYNNGLIIQKKELEKVNKICKNNKSKYYKKGLTINNSKQIIINNYQVNDTIYFMHCKKYNESYLFLITSNYKIVINYNGEYLPYQYDIKIQQLINNIKNIF